MKSTLAALVVFVGFGTASSASAASAARPDLSAPQIEALRQAVCLAEPVEAVQAVFADLASGPAGTSQQEMLKSRLRADNLSFFCLTGPLNREGAAAGYEYAPPAVEQIAQASMRLVQLGTVVTTDDVQDVRWDAPIEGQAQGRFVFDTGTGYKGACLFRATQDGEAWKIVHLAIQKTGSDNLEDGLLVFRLP